MLLPNAPNARCRNKSEDSWTVVTSVLQRSPSASPQALVDVVSMKTVTANKTWVGVAFIIISCNSRNPRN